MNETERYIFEKLSEVGRSNVPFARLAAALAADPNIKVTVPEPQWEPGQLGSAQTIEGRKVGLVERGAPAPERLRFRYVNKDGDSVYASRLNGFKPMVALTRADLFRLRTDIQRALYEEADIKVTERASRAAMGAINDFFSAKGFSIDD